MTVFDQYEVEPLLSYSGSIADGVFFGGVYSGSSNIPELEKLLVGSTVKPSSLLTITGSFVTTASLRVFTYNSNTSSISLVDPIKQIPVLTSDLVRFYKNGYVGTSTRYSMAFSRAERFTDSVMPEPVEIYLSGAVDPSGAPVASTSAFVFSLRHHARFQISSSCMILCGNLPVPEVYNLNIGAGNQVWQNDFPFEPKYKNINKNSNIQSQKKIPPSGDAGIINNPPFSDGLWSFATGFTFFRNAAFNNSIAYWGFYDLLHGYASFNTSSIYPLPTNSTRITRSFFELEDFAFSGSLTESNGKIVSLPWVSGVAQPPTAETFNLHFFGFGKMFGKFAEPGIFTSSLNFATGAVTESSPTREFFVITGTFSGIRLDGYKYGCYSPVPAYSKAVFRRNHFGFLRDMLEQRPNTTFFDERRGVSLEAAVTINFLTASQAYLTASSADPYLNARSSGMFDFGYRAGRPFFE